MQNQNKAKVEFGDFQTPSWFCNQVCTLLAEKGFKPLSIVEPACGQGNFLLSALGCFSSAKASIGLDINPDYIDLLQEKISYRSDRNRIELIQADFFTANWQKILKNLPEPLLIIGNPPWVTNSQLATLESENVPEKKNFQKQPGIAAITGGSNFDISEWILLRIFDWAEKTPAVVAMLCKTSVARKVLLQTWQNVDACGDAQLFLIDSKAVFGVSVDACLLVYDTLNKSTTKSCDVFNTLSTDSFLFQIGYRHKQLIANLGQFERWEHLQNRHKPNDYQWRSGVKHDCASVMEFEQLGETFVNKLGESIDLEETYLYPMLKSSDIAKSVLKSQTRWMLVTQKTVGENTTIIKSIAPKTWAYLTRHHRYFDKRKSKIYKNRPPFSIFGVGDYSFASWKVAISGLYKQLKFVVVPSVADKPTVLDDTCYFLPCKSEAEATLITQLLNSEVAQQFYQSFIFWDAKRPITAKILNKLDIYRLAQELGCREELEQQTISAGKKEQARQLILLERASGNEQYKP